MSKLLDLMRALGRDAALEAEYEKDPEAVARRAGLSDEECRAIIEKDYPAIMRLTGLKEVMFVNNHTVKAYDD